MTPTFEQLGIWMVCALFALDIYLKVKAAQRGDQPQKREISFQTEFARKGEVQTITDRLERVEKSIEVIHEEMKEDRATLMTADEQRASEIHKRINQLSQEFNDKFQAVPHEVVAMLRNIGVIK